MTSVKNEQRIVSRNGYARGRAGLQLSGRKL